MFGLWKATPLEENVASADRRGCACRERCTRLSRPERMAHASPSRVPPSRKLPRSVSFPGYLVGQPRRSPKALSQKQLAVKVIPLRFANPDRMGRAHA